LMMGYHAGVMVALLKGFLHFILPFSTSIFIGEIIFTTSSVIVALATYFIYCKLTKCHLLMSLTLISLLYIVLQCLSNYFIVLPLYEAKPLSELAQNSAYLKTILTVYLPFNLIKMVLVSTITYLLTQKVFRLS
jgi:riboflavin transporter